MLRPLFVKVLRRLERAQVEQTLVAETDLGRTGHANFHFHVLVVAVLARQDRDTIA